MTKFNSITYLVYVIFCKVLIFGGCGYVVFVLGESPWWFALAILLAEGSIKPERWAKLDNEQPHNSSEG